MTATVAWPTFEAALIDRDLVADRTMAFRFAKPADWTYRAGQFIDITLRPDMQAIIGNNGGVPVAAKESDITDAKSKELIANFNTLTERDGLGYYPDWPTSTFYDQLNAGLQSVLNGSSSPKQVNEELGQQYADGVKAVTG